MPAMGNEEQIAKPERRKGDTVALYAAIVSLAHPSTDCAR